MEFNDISASYGASTLIKTLKKGQGNYERV